MSVLKRALRRAAATLTGHDEPRQSVASLSKRVDAAGTITRESAKRLKDATQSMSDRLIALERQTTRDREAMLTRSPHSVPGRSTRSRSSRGCESCCSAPTSRWSTRSHSTRPQSIAPLCRRTSPARLRQRRCVPSRSRTWSSPSCCRRPSTTRWLPRFPPRPSGRDAGYMRENWHVVEDRASRFSETTWRFMHREVAARMLMPLLLLAVPRADRRLLARYVRSRRLRVHRPLFLRRGAPAAAAPGPQARTASGSAERDSDRAAVSRAAR